MAATSYGSFLERGSSLVDMSSRETASKELQPERLPSEDIREREVGARQNLCGDPTCVFVSSPHKTKPSFRIKGLRARFGGEQPNTEERTAAQGGPLARIARSSSMELLYESDNSTRLDELHDGFCVLRQDLLTWGEWCRVPENKGAMESSEKRRTISDKQLLGALLWPIIVIATCSPIFYPTFSTRHKAPASQSVELVRKALMSVDPPSHS